MSRRRGASPTLTATGGGVSITALAILALGMVLGYPALTVVGVGGIVLVVVGWFVAAGVPRLDVHREIEPARVERGQAALGLVQVRNRTRRRTRACRGVEQLPDGDVPVAIPALRPGRSSSVPYRLPTRRRGAVTVGPFAIVGGDPFGLWRARREVGGTALLLVRPRVHHVDPRPAGRNQHLDGPTSDSAPRGTLTFHTLREYVPGDDIRRIHWKTTARTGTLMVREHVDTSQPSTVIVLDVRRDRYVDADGGTDRFEEAVDVAASLVGASQRQGFPVRFVTTTGDVHLVRAGQRGQRLADHLAAVQPADDGSLQRASVAALGGRDRDAIIVIGGRLDATDLAGVTQMSRRFGYRAVVTLRDAAATGPLWPSGLHLDGDTAQAALARWAR